MTDKPNKYEVLQLTVDIVSAHLANNTVATTDIPRLIQDIYGTLINTGADTPAVDRPKPAVNPKRSVLPDYIVCLEDGKKLKMLKRHLKTAYDMTPEEYRDRWGLSADYPMVAPNYARHRSSLAKKIGLGKKPKGGGRNRAK